MKTLVVEASFALHACPVEGGFAILGGARAAAPALRWSEARSVIRETLSRDAVATCPRLGTCPVERVERPDLHDEIWRVATEPGWAKTHDAE